MFKIWRKRDPSVHLMCNIIYSFLWKFITYLILRLYPSRDLQLTMDAHSILVLVIGSARRKFLKVATPASLKLLLIAVWNSASDFWIILTTEAANSEGFYKDLAWRWENINKPTDKIPLEDP
jgi:hypothetical protein